MTANRKAPRPCQDCGRLPKLLPSHFCTWCRLKRQPMHVQAMAAEARLEAIPEALRMKRSQKIITSDTPEGLAFCAGCQTFCPDWMFASGATQCRPCVSRKGHAARTEKTYGITSGEYARILEVQGGRCAICFGTPKSARLAVDHDHQSGSVRGLLDARCNHDLLGALHDQRQAAWNAFVYLSYPPATPGVIDWGKFLAAHPMPDLAETRVAFTRPQKTEAPAPKVAEVDACTKGQHFRPVGSKPVPGKDGLYIVWASDNADSPY